MEILEQVADYPLYPSLRNACSNSHCTVIINSIGVLHASLIGYLKSMWSGLLLAG